MGQQWPSFSGGARERTHAHNKASSLFRLYGLARGRKEKQNRHYIGPAALNTLLSRFACCVVCVCVCATAPLCSRRSVCVGPAAAVYTDT